MKVLVACEESQAVCKAFREKGHEAYSCDIIECSGGHPEWHIKGDVLKILNPEYYDGRYGITPSISFYTMNGDYHQFDGKWDMIIAFPPCTHLAVSGARHFEKKRADGRQREGIEFFCQFLNADCERTSIENPVGIISGNYIKQHFPELSKQYNLPLKATQKIQPYEFGHPYSKTTCLWLKGLPKLQPTEILQKPESGWINQCFTKDGRYGGFASNFQTAKERSKTFPGIAKAMAEQWG
jgi:hypothetical protein